MHYSEDFLAEIKKRAANRCECERGSCHSEPGRCREALREQPDGSPQWSPILTGEHITFPPAAHAYIALCTPCAVPRSPTRPTAG